MKYLREVKGGFLFNPPQDAIKAGIVKRKFYKDGRGYRYEVPRFISLIEAWRKGKLSPEILNPKSRLLECIAFYLDSKQFNSLAVSSQNNYQTSLDQIMATQAFREGRMRLNELTVGVCKKAYEEWLDRSVAYANATARIFGVLINFCASLDLIQINPMSKVKKLHHEPETTIWTRDQVRQFLEVAFSEYKWRSVGLVVFLCYEWGQRPVDIRNLRWEQINFEDKVCTIKQSKRGATVYLPVDEEIEKLLIEQKELVDFQPWVCPNFNTSDNVPKPYNSAAFSRIVKEIRNKAELPEDLKVGGLRKTAIVEARDSGVDAPGLMQFTGHKSLNSLSPYMKFTPKGAKAALSRRKNND